MAYQQPYQPYQQPAYPPAPPMYPVAPRTSTLAIVSLIAGLVGWVIGVGPIVAIICGHMAKKEINNSMGQISGSGMATAGLILGYLQLGLGLCGACVYVLMIAGVIGSGFMSQLGNTLLPGLVALLG
ncbi:MAG: DUF4190 domain-containing protein [Anaerolineae bacterium]